MAGNISPKMSGTYNTSTKLVQITDNNSSNETVYLTWVPITNATLAANTPVPLQTSSANLNWNPSTQVLGAAGFSAGSGNYVGTWAGNPIPVANGGTGVTKIPNCSVYNSSTTTLSAGTYTKIHFQTANWDTGSYFDITTNYRYQPLIAGTYHVTCSMQYGASANIVAGTQYAVLLYKNGNAYKDLDNEMNVGVATTCQGRGSCLVQLNGSTDFIEVYGYNGNAGTVPTSAAAASCYLDIVWVGP